MARQHKRLSDEAVAEANSPGMYPDGMGLYLRVGPAGAKSWVFRYRIGKGRRDKGLGSVHTVTLACARAKAVDFRNQISQQNDLLHQLPASRSNVEATDPAELAHRNTLIVLENLAGFAKSELRRLGYPDDFNSPKAKEVLRVRYGEVAREKDSRKGKECSRAIGLYGVLLDLTGVGAAVARREYPEAMYHGLLAMGALVAPLTDLTMARRRYGQLGGRTEKLPDWPLAELLEFDEEIRRTEPGLLAVRRHEKIAEDFEMKPRAVRAALWPPKRLVALDNELCATVPRPGNRHKIIAEASGNTSDAVRKALVRQRKKLEEASLPT